MAVAFIALYYWSDISRVNVQAPYYEHKVKAAQTVVEAMDVLKDYRLPHLDLGSKAGGITDPLVFTMLGEKDSPITTDEGRIEDKITALNPNFAAAVVNMLMQTGVSAGDTIAVLLTGSLPGANLAVFAAAKALRLHPVVTTSVGSSWWGANSPDFTWLDMELVLERAGIFKYRSIAASIGGADDHGGLRLSRQGRDMIVEAIDRNNVTLIQQGNLSSNIQGRLEVYRRVAPLTDYKAVINVGGGIASIGHRLNSHLIPTGVNLRLPVKNYPNLGCIHYFSNAGVPVVMIGDVKEVAEAYDLPVSQLPLPVVGVGRVFEHERYNLTIASVALVLMFIILVVVKYLDRKTYRYSEQKIDPDTIV